MTRVLVVDAHGERRAARRRVLEGGGLVVVEAARLLDADLDPVDVVVYCADGVPSAELASISRRVPTILLVERGTIGHAVEAMKLGAADYLAGPLDPDEITRAIDQAAACRFRSVQRSLAPMIGHCPAMRGLHASIHALAPLECPVLIRGESGSGKELAARALHDGSRRRHGPFISLNCAAIPQHLIESELFGDEASDLEERRVGLLDAAQGGSLFLDEIGALPLPAQARLLRVLDLGAGADRGRAARSRNVRLIAATQRNLADLVQSGHFLEELLRPLEAVSLTVPPLRERGGDVVQLAEELLCRVCEKLNRPQLRFAPDTLELVQRYHWPGNVRELANAIERAVILSDEALIRPDLLGIDLAMRGGAPLAAIPAASLEPTSLEDYFIKFVLEHQDTLTETELSHKLGISRKSLWERRQRLGIPRRGTHKRGKRRDAH